MSRLDTGDAPDFVYWALTHATVIFDDLPKTLPATIQNDTDFDGSLLVSWAAGRCAVTVPQGAANLLAYCLRYSKIITVAEALSTRGALLFSTDGSLVAISLGDGERTIEAAGRMYGVRPTGASGVYGTRWFNAAWVPGLRYQ